MTRWRRGLGLLVVCGWWAGLTHDRLAVWQDELSLWTAAAAVTPTKIRPVLNLARARELKGDFVSAEMGYRAVFDLTADPRRSTRDRRFARAAAVTNLAHLNMKRGNLASAMRQLDEALILWPDFPYAHYNRAVILWWVGACAEAERSYALARAYEPGFIAPSEPCTPAS